jgi:hypothetical protein
MGKEAFFNGAVSKTGQGLDGHPNIMRNVLMLQYLC